MATTKGTKGKGKGTTNQATKGKGKGTTNQATKGKGKGTTNQATKGKPAAGKPPEETRPQEPTLAETKKEFARFNAAAQEITENFGIEDPPLWVEPESNKLDDLRASLAQVKTNISLFIQKVMAQGDMDNVGDDTRSVMTEIAKDNPSSVPKGLCGEFGINAAAKGTKGKGKGKGKGDSSPAGKDEFGRRLGSKTAALNKLLASGEFTPEEAAKEAQLTPAHVKGHIRALTKEGHTIETLKDGKVKAQAKAA
jgi:hypothetical protein